MVKITSHQSEARVLRGGGGCSWAHWAGNKAADRAAKRGAALHPTRPGLAQRLQAAAEHTEAVAMWIGRLGAHLVTKGRPDIDATLPRAQRVTGHAKVKLQLQCAFGGERPTEEQPGRSDQASVMSVGPPAALRSRVHSTHVLYRTGPVLFCWHCGGHCHQRGSR